MTRIMSIFTALVMAISLFASYVPSADAAEASKFFFDYTDGYKPNATNTPYTNTNTRASYDASQKALKITTAGKRADEANGQKIGQMQWLPETADTNVPIAEYPYFAVKIKVASDAVTEPTSHYSARVSYSGSFGTILKPLAGYDSYTTGKWVLYICDGYTVLNNSSYYGDGRWLGNIFRITENKDLADGKVHDLAWVQWAGAFSSTALKAAKSGGEPAAAALSWLLISSTAGTGVSL